MAGNDIIKKDGEQSSGSAQRTTEGVPHASNLLYIMTKYKRPLLYLRSDLQKCCHPCG